MALVPTAVMAPVEDDGLRSELRLFLDTQLNDRHSAWQMDSNGVYMQLQSTAVPVKLET